MMGKCTAQEAARYIVKRSIKLQCPVSNLQLQKLLYFAQVNYLHSSGNEPLFEDDIEAWQYGPVVPDVYFTYSMYGGMPITKPAVATPSGEGFFKFEPIDNIEERDDAESFIKYIDMAINKWINNPAWQLVSETHKEGSPWAKVWCDGAGLRSVIPVSEMRAAAH